MNKGKTVLVILLLLIFTVGGCLGGFLLNSFLLARTKGSITISSKPDGATIVWNGEEIEEKTDFVLANVFPGKNIIELKKKGYCNWKTKVTVSPGEKVNIVAFLVKKSAGAKIEKEAEEEKPEYKDTVAPSTPALVSPSDNVVYALNFL